MAGYTSVNTSDLSEKEECLLEGGRYEDNDTQEGFMLQRRSRSWIRQHLLPISLHSLLLVGNVLFCLAYTRYISSKCSHGPQHQYCKLPLYSTEPIVNIANRG